MVTRRSIEHGRLVRNPRAGAGQLFENVADPISRCSLSIQLDFVGFALAQYTLPLSCPPMVARNLSCQELLFGCSYNFQRQNSLVPATGYKEQ